MTMYYATCEIAHHMYSIYLEKDCLQRLSCTHLPAGPRLTHTHTQGDPSTRRGATGQAHPKKQTQRYCGATTKKGNREGPRTRSVGTVGLATAMAQRRIAHIHILSAVTHGSSGNMETIRGRRKTQEAAKKGRWQVASGTPAKSWSEFLTIIRGDRSEQTDERRRKKEGETQKNDSRTNLRGRSGLNAGK